MHHLAEHLEMNGYKVEIIKIVNGLIILNMWHLLWHNYEKKHFWKEVQCLKVWLFREKICFIISDYANKHSVQSWNTHRHHETIMCTWKSHRKWGQADVLQTLGSTCQVRIFAV